MVVTGFATVGSTKLFVVLPVVGEVVPPDARVVVTGFPTVASTEVLPAAPVEVTGAGALSAGEPAWAGRAPANSGRSMIDVATWGEHAGTGWPVAGVVQQRRTSTGSFETESEWAGLEASANSSTVGKVSFLGSLLRMWT